MDAISSINPQMSTIDQAKVAQQVDTFNKIIAGGKAQGSQNLGKDDFLKILITQLTTQDPTAPMQDKDFIAQMAQFSSLEQMTNMSTSFGKVQSVLNASQAVSTLGKSVEILANGELVKGTVTEVTPGQFPQVLVGDKYYDYSTVQKISQVEGK
ncbi:MAG: flagellar hook assembly protein FlgD [Spirochaetales bacterium]